MHKQQSGRAWLSPTGSPPQTRGRDPELCPAPCSLAPARAMAATWNFPSRSAPGRQRLLVPEDGVCHRAVILARRDEVWVGFKFFSPPQTGSKNLPLIIIKSNKLGQYFIASLWRCSIIASISPRESLRA